MTRARARAVILILHSVGFQFLDHFPGEVLLGHVGGEAVWAAFESDWLWLVYFARRAQIMGKVVLI